MADCLVSGIPNCEAFIQWNLILFFTFVYVSKSDSKLNYVPAFVSLPKLQILFPNNTFTFITKSKFVFVLNLLLIWQARMVMRCYQNWYVSSLQPNSPRTLRRRSLKSVTKSVRKRAGVKWNGHPTMINPLFLYHPEDLQLHQCHSYPRPPPSSWNSTPSLLE